MISLECADFLLSLLVLLLGRFPDRKILLDEPLLQEVPLCDSLVMMIKHAKPVLDLNQLLLREPLDVSRLEHLDTLIILVEDEARVGTEAGSITHFGMNLLRGGKEAHTEFTTILRILSLRLARLGVSAFEGRHSIRRQVDLVSIRDQLEE